MTSLKRELDEKSGLRHWKSWLPVETAPKGVEVLLGWWFDWPKKEWQCDIGAAYNHDMATHWMPLPPPPEEK